MRLAGAPEAEYSSGSNFIARSGVMGHSGIRGLAVVIGAVLAITGSQCFGAEKAAKGEKVEKAWSYSGANGPAKWGSLDKAFEDCRDGQLQSPIDIPATGPFVGELPSLLFDYRPVPLRIIDTGHTIQVGYAPGSFLMVAGKKYELQQLQFHKPGEEKIGGKGHDMSVHLVHKGPDGKPAIVAVPLDSGGENRLMKVLWDNLPKEKGKENAVDSIQITATDLLPKDKGYYTYSGSLTMPPCTEDVTWFVMKTPVKISADAIARFARYYPMNARPTEPLNGRYIQSTR
jgi:carbonic anhydrase